MATTGLIDYNQVWYTVHKSWFEFAAAADHSLYILLAKYPGNSDTDVFEVIFGAEQNSKTIIRENRCALSLSTS